MAKDTNISWAGSTLNVGIGCERVSEGCDACYAEDLVGRYAGLKGWPASFGEGIWKPEKLADIEKWAKQGGRRIFVNSLSDVHWNRWEPSQVAALYDAMLAQPAHDYLVLTKRPKQMYEFLVGSEQAPHGWLERRGLDAVPAHIWLGTSIESNKYAFRADVLRRIPAVVRFISAEPLLGFLPGLNLDEISWVIAGGESGPTHRPMRLSWAEDLMHAVRDQGAAFFFKQVSDRRPGQGADAFGGLIHEYPLPHPSLGLERELGVYLDPLDETPVVVSGPRQESLL